MIEPVKDDKVLAQGVPTETETRKTRIKIRPFGQKNYSCGPACLKAVFDYWGVAVSESEIADIAGTSRNGTSIDGLVKASRHFGFDALVKRNASLDDLRGYIGRDIPVIVAWFLKDDGHYSVVVDINKNNIVLSDPALKRPFVYGNTRKMSCQKFQRLWFDFPDDYIKEPKDLILRLMIVVTPKEESEE
jgi:predicted double-glycine peptidase